MRDLNIEKLTKRAIAVYTQERAALVSGDANALSAAGTQKAKLLADLVAAETAAGSVSGSGDSSQIRNQLESLNAIIARRTSENDQLARARSACG